MLVADRQKQGQKKIQGTYEEIHVKLKNYFCYWVVSAVDSRGSVVCVGGENILPLADAGSERDP